MPKVQIKVNLEALVKQLPDRIEQKISHLNLEWKKGGESGEGWEPGRITAKDIEKHLSAQEMYDLWSHLSDAVSLIREIRNRQLEEWAAHEEDDQ